MERLKISYVLRESKSRSNGEAPIYARIIIDSQRAEFTTKQFTQPKNWDSRSQELKGRSELARTINNYLLELKANVQQNFNVLSQKEGKVTAKQLRDIIIGKAKTRYGLVKIFSENNALLKQEVDKKYSASTVNQYATTLSRLKEFIKKEYQSNEYLLEDLDVNFIRKFDNFLRLEYKASDNTSLKYLKQVKRVIHYGMELGYLKHDPFFGYKTNFQKGKREFLSAEELMKIETHDFKLTRLDQVRDIFVFACYTGLSYSDLKNLSLTSITKGIDGKNWIIYEREKTGVRASIPLLNPAQRIIDKYKNDPWCLVNRIPLPIKSKQRLNSYLMEIEEICGISKHITMHIGRHTFATTVTLTNGVPMETVQKMLGHTNISTTQIYSKVIDSKISIDMESVEQKLSHQATKKAN